MIMNKLSAYSGKNKKAFSIMEVMISAFILSVGLTAVIALMAGNIKNSINARDSIIASGLAQEGVELVRNIRDNNFVNNPENPFLWLDETGGKKIAYNEPLGNSNTFALYYSGNGFYDHGLGGTVTKFRRKISIANYVDVGTGRKITSTVWWDGSVNVPSSCNIATKCVYVEDILTDWIN